MKQKREDSIAEIKNLIKSSILYKFPLNSVNISYWISKFKYLMKKKFGILKIRNLNFIAMNEWILAIQIEAIWFYMYDFVCKHFFVAKNW